MHINNSTIITHLQKHEYRKNSFFFSAVEGARNVKKYMYAYTYIKYLYSALQRFECWAFFLQEAWFCCLDFNTPLRFPVRRSDEKRVWAKRVVEDVGENNSRIQEGGRTSAKQLSKWSFPEPVLPPRNEENFPKKGKDPESWKSELGKNQTKVTEQV